MKYLNKFLFIFFLLNLQNIDSASIHPCCHPQEIVQCTCIKPNLIYQNEIPFVITKSGEYRLAQNIFFNANGNAITIAANNVKLNLAEFSISLTNNSTGIFVNNVSEFEIKSDAIESTNNTNCIGIHVFNSNKGLIKNVFTQNHVNGLIIEKSGNIAIKDSQFYGAGNAAVLVKESTNIVFRNCEFAQSGNGLTFNGSNNNCQIYNCNFPSSAFANLRAQQINGLIVENCLFNNNVGNPAKTALVQFGDAEPQQICKDVIFKNCTIINRPTGNNKNTVMEGLGIYQGSGFLVESCVIDIDNTNQDPAADLSGIHVSNPGLGKNGTVASNVIIRNCIVQGPSTDGYYPDVGTTGCVIENCLAVGALKDGIFLAGTKNSTIKNNTVVNNGTNGIFLGETSVSNSIYNNIVNNNGFNPITNSLPPLGNGIAIASDSSKNTVQYNEVFNNAKNGIDDQGTQNQIFYNKAYANANKNFNATTDSIIVNRPGRPCKSAENISA